MRFHDPWLLLYIVKILLPYNVVPYNVIPYNAVTEYHGDIYCYRPQNHKCEKTSITYGKVCFQSYQSCRKFTYQPLLLWYFEADKNECRRTASNKSGLTLLVSKTDCEAIYRKSGKSLKRSTRGCSKSEASCYRATQLHFGFVQNKEICQLKISHGRANSSPAYPTYKSCSVDNAERYCLDQNGQCVKFPRKQHSARLCFGYEIECDSFSKWNSEIWFFDKERLKCRRTLPSLKSKHLEYFSSMQLCMDKRFYCYEYKSGHCTQRSLKRPCNPLENLFFTEKECRECQYNNGKMYFIENDRCLESNLDHEFTYLHCSMSQCLYRLNISFTYVDPAIYGSYNVYNGCVFVHDMKGRDPTMTFKTREECLKKSKSDEELVKKYERYAYRDGFCQPTMNMSKPKIYMTMEECERRSDVAKMWYIDRYNGNRCREAKITHWNKHKEWFDTYEECKAFFTRRLDNKESFLDVIGTVGRTLGPKDFEGGKVIIGWKKGYSN